MGDGIVPKASDDSRPSAIFRVPTQIRLDEYTYAKGKVLAAIYDESFNAVLIRALRNEIKRYEEKYGEIPRQIYPDD